MKIRIVEYLGYSGGVERFLTQMLVQFRTLHPDVELEIVSHGSALEMYRKHPLPAAIGVRVVDIQPENSWYAYPAERTAGLPGTRRLKYWMGAGTQSYYTVAPSVFHGCDAVWVPAVSRHRIPDSYADRAIGTLHDIIPLQFDGYWAPRPRREEIDTHHRWLRSAATVLITSNTTRAGLERLYGTIDRELIIIPILARHTGTEHALLEGESWAWSKHPFLLCPANLGVHKNHRLLLRGVNQWGKHYPLVLSGHGSELDGAHPRSLEVRTDALGLGFSLGRSLIPLGYLDAAQYQAVLERAWALVMPTLAEGGGSYPVLEAMLEGIPVLCTDIPALREQIERTGGAVQWLDPDDPQVLADRLEDLERQYDQYRQRAESQVDALRVDTWRDVAEAYWQVFLRVTKSTGR